MKRFALLAAMAVIVGFCSSGASAALIFSDNISYADNSALQSVWGANATLGGSVTFGQLQTGGASISLTNTDGGFYPSSTVASRSLGIGAGTFDSNNDSADPLYGVPIWSSYLIQPTSSVYVSNPYGGTGTILGGYYSNSDGGGHRLQSSPAYSPSYSGTQSFAGDDKTRGTPAFTISPGTTYLAVGYLAKNGQNYNYGADIQAKEWLFTEQAFSDWVAAGQNEADLGTYAVSEADYSYNASFGFSTLDASSLINVQALNGSAEFGDFLAGTTLADVTPVVTPEPSTAGFLLISSALLGLRRRRAAGSRQ